MRAVRVALALAFVAAIVVVGLAWVQAWRDVGNHMREPASTSTK